MRKDGTLTSDAHHQHRPSTKIDGGRPPKVLKSRRDVKVNSSTVDKNVRPSEESLKGVAVLEGLLQKINVGNCPRRPSLNFPNCFLADRELPTARTL